MFFGLRLDDLHGDFAMRIALSTDVEFANGVHPGVKDRSLLRGRGLRTAREKKDKKEERVAVGHGSFRA